MNGQGKDIVTHGAFYGLLTALIGVVGQLAHKDIPIDATASAILVTVGFVHTIVSIIKTKEPITSLFGVIKLNKNTQDTAK